MSASPIPAATTISRTNWWRRMSRLEAPAFWIGAFVLTVWLLSISWQKWMDPLIDFGTQLYIPWRITLGEHLARDVVHPYGPLSSYINAGLFRVFGVSVQTLVNANLVIYAAIFTCLHFLLRRAFGFAPAAFATLAAIAIFGFSHFTGLNNYTYAAPYSHEATHGLLLLLLLLLRLNREWSRPRSSGWVAGLLCGLIALTKIEIVFAGGVALVGFALARFKFHAAAPAVGRWTLELVAAAAGALFAAWVLLALVTDAHSAAIAVGSGTIAPLLYPSYVTSAQSQMILGTDQPVAHATTMLLCGGMVAVIILVLSALIAGWLRVERPRRWFIWIAPVGLWLLAGWWFSDHVLTTAGNAIPALLAFGGAVIWWSHRKQRGAALTARAFAQLLLLVVAGALMARMVLAPRIFHYGFVQALLAGAWLMAFFVGEWPRRLPTSRMGRRMVGFTFAALLTGVAWSLLGVSRNFYAMKTQSIGVGGRRVFRLRPRDDERPSQRGARARIPGDQNKFLVDALGDPGGADAELSHAAKNSPADHQPVAGHDAPESAPRARRPHRASARLCFVHLAHGR